MIIEIVVAVDVIKIMAWIEAITERVCGVHSLKWLIIGKLYVAPPPLPILT
jgi:hypothetical protein